MARYDLVIFDFDGTLADSFPWFWAVLPELSAEFRLKPLDSARKDEYRRLSARAMVQETGVRWWQMPFIARRFRQRMAAQTQHIRLFDGVAEALARLHAAGIPMAVVSSNSLANVQQILGPALVAQIAHFGCGAPVLGKKGRTRRALRALGATPGRSVCIGDELRDADVARAVGVDFAAVSWGYTVPQAFVEAGCGEILAAPSAMADWVLGTRAANECVVVDRSIQGP